MLIREKMTTDIVTINISDTLLKAEKLLLQHNFHHLPVISGNKLSGILSASDIEQFKKNRGVDDTKNISISEIMPAQQRLVTTVPDVSIEQAIMLMQNNKIGSLPVMENGKLIGIITLSDILNTFVDLLWVKRSRLSVELGPQAGLLAEVAGIIGGFNVPILRIVMFPQAGKDSFQALISLDTDDVKPIIEKLQEKGYVIIDDY